MIQMRLVTSLSHCNQKSFFEIWNSNKLLVDIINIAKQYHKARLIRPAARMSTLILSSTAQHL